MVFKELSKSRNRTLIQALGKQNRSDAFLLYREPRKSSSRLRGKKAIPEKTSGTYSAARFTVFSLRNCCFHLIRRVDVRQRRTRGCELHHADVRQQPRRMESERNAANRLQREIQLPVSLPADRRRPGLRTATLSLRCEPGRRRNP